MNDFDDVLLDVRSAFRILFAFTRAITGLVRFIGEKFNIVFE
jgi:hypothetical protein